MNIDPLTDEYFAYASLKLQPTSLLTYRMYLSRYIQHEGIERVEDITLPSVVRFLHNLKGRGYKDNTINSYSSAIRSFLKYLKYAGKKDVLEYESVPFTLKVENESHEAVTEDDFKLLIESNGWESNEFDRKRNFAILHFLYATGARNNEICSIKAHQIDLEKRRAVILTLKSRKKRVILWDHETNEALKDYLDIREKQGITDQHLFVSSRTSEKINPRFLQRLVERYAKQSGIKKKIVPHSFRHGLAHQLMNAGAGERVVQVLLGHKSIVSTQVYMPYDELPLRKVYDRARSYKYKTINELGTAIAIQNSIGRYA